MTKLLAILNLTPDSFSDGGQVDDVLAAIDRLIEDGTDGIDIGAESTRPGATPLAPEAEWARLEPVLAEAIDHCHTRGVIVSLDTRHAHTAWRALELGVDWINDVGGFGDAAMIEAVKASDCKLVVMHALTIPADAGITLPDDADPVAEIARFFDERRQELEEQGIAPDRLIYDPGIGFGKSRRQSLALMQRMDELEAPLLVGHSRKSFLSLFTDRPAAERDDLTLAFSAMMAGKVAWLRVHEVKRHRALLNQLEAGA